MKAIWRKNSEGFWDFLTGDDIEPREGDAEYAVWDCALEPEEIALLAVHAVPAFRIRPECLVEYACTP